MDMCNFRESLLKRLDETGVSLRQVAQGSGVSYEQLKKLKQVKTRSTNVDDAIRVAKYFGMTLDEFIAGSKASDQQEIIDLLDALSDDARAFLVNAAKAQLAADQASREDRE